MIDDPIVDEIHRYRREHAAKYGNDLKKIVEALQEHERTSGREYRNFEPKPRVLNHEWTRILTNKTGD